MWERELWPWVQAEAAVSPAAAAGPAAHGQKAQHSYMRSEEKERRNLGWVRTEDIYQTLYMFLALTHAHPCLYQAQKGHLFIIHPSDFPGSLRKTEVTFKRTPSCSTNRMLCPWAGGTPGCPQERWDFRRFLRPALAPRCAPFIRPLNWPCIFARFLEGARSRKLVWCKHWAHLTHGDAAPDSARSGTADDRELPNPPKKTLTKCRIKPVPTLCPS